MTGAFAIALLNPIICAALAVTVFAVARNFPKSGHLYYLSAALASTSVAFLANDIFRAYDGPVLRIVVNLAFYVAIHTAAVAALHRVNANVSTLRASLLALATTAGFLWFLFVTPSTDARIYIVNSAYLVICATVIWKLVRAKPSSKTDWIVIIFAVLLMMISITRPVANAIGALGPQSDGTAYWLSVTAFTPIITVYCTLVFLWALGKQLYEDLREEAGKDYLTGVLNRRGFAQSTALMKCTNEDNAALLVIADIDDFKSINGTFGHTKGDQILRLVADTLSEHTPRGAVARTGGEEFSIYIPNGTLAEAEQLAHHVATSLEQAKSRLLPDGRPLTLSFGASQAANTTLQEMTLSADKALYAAKAAGKNRLSFA